MIAPKGTTSDHVAITYVITYGDRANRAPTDSSDHDDSAGVSECLGELLLVFGFNLRLFDSPTVGTALLAIVVALADVLVIASADRRGTDDPENDDICNAAGRYVAVGPRNTVNQTITDIYKAPENAAGMSSSRPTFCFDQACRKP